MASDDERAAWTPAELVAVEAARARWPEVKVDDARFREHLRDLVPPEERGESLPSWHVVDLYLAFACGCGDPAALRAFERDVLSRVPAFVANVASSPAFVDEVRQVLREKLFVAGDAGRPKIFAYSGRGTIEGWVRVVAVNVAHSLLRKAEPASDPVEKADEAVPGGDVEMDYIKSRYRADFEAALRESFAALEMRERNLLRLHFLDGLSIDGIGAAYGTHRATAARWLAAAKEALVKGTRKVLRARLNLTQAELDSVLALVQSRLEASVAGLFRSETRPAAPEGAAPEGATPQETPAAKSHRGK